MAHLEYDELTFTEEEARVKVSFLQNYYFFIDKNSLERIGEFKITREYIKLNVSQKKAENKFNLLISNGLQNLKNKYTGRKTIYIDQNSGIPLIGNSAFGIIDRNTSLIEIKPVTGCNLNCIFCSVDEGKEGRWVTDYIVDADYIIRCVEELANFKGCKVEAHIGTHGEPLLYPQLVELVQGLSNVKNVGKITIDTNGTLLTKKLIDKLAVAGLTRIQLSLNATNSKIASKMAGSPYNLDHVLDMLDYSLGKIDVLIAPIWVPGINDGEIEKLVKFGIEKGIKVCIQNFLVYKYGRKPSKQMPWPQFQAKLMDLEKIYNTKLLFDKDDFGIQKTKVLPKPFKKGQTVKAKIICDGRLKNEKIAVAGNRNISIPNCRKKGIVRIKITRDKHNIFFGTC